MPIFCYLCGMLTHDENDCLVGLRRTEQMNAEDKPYGPWLRATQERLQKPQLVLAPSRDTDKEVQKNPDLHIQAVTRSDRHSQSPVKGTNPQMMAIKDNEKGKAEMGVVVVTTEAKIPQIPHKPRGSQFEEQLKEIDTAIFGDTLDTTNHHKAMQSTGMTEVIQTNVQATHTQMKVEDDAKHDGPQEMSKSNMTSTLGSQPQNGPANKAQVNFTTLPPFIMGLTSLVSPTKPKPKKSNQINLRKG